MYLDVRVDGYQIDRHLDWCKNCSKGTCGLYLHEEDLTYLSTDHILEKILRIKVIVDVKT